ncbi:MAG: hotdog fold thioesterase, partial [Anaerolineales bacterium]|nr:hotdog fold thioesterase [Anaerolineales bacterium]
MSIWFGTPTLEKVINWHDDTMAEHIGLVFTEIGDDYLRAEMAISGRTVQPFRNMHGGASATMAETLGSVAAQLTVDDDKQRCVGLSLNISHIRAVPEGQTLTGTARPFHIGRTTQV